MIKSGQDQNGSEGDGAIARPMKADRVSNVLRQRVLSGQLRPGQRLPAWDEMETEFSIARPTLMRALAFLKRDGLLVADSTRGTFVAERPPHLYRYAMVFFEGPGQPGWNRLWEGLDAHAVSLGRDSKVEISRFYWTEPHADNDSYQRLIRQAQAGRLAGVIVVGGGPLVEQTTIEAIPVPVVAIQTEKPRPAWIPTIDVDFDSFIHETLSRLRDAGRKRPAILTNVHNPLNTMFERLGEYGLSAKPSWLQSADTSHPAWAGQVVRLLLDTDRGERPDALVITDENLASPAFASIVELGVRVPQDLMIVTHSSHTRPIAEVVPMTRLGFDTRAMLTMAIDAINCQRENKPVAPVQLLKAQLIE